MIDLSKRQMIREIIVQAKKINVLCLRLSFK